MERLVQSASALGRALRDARRRRGFTQQELARRAGVAQPTVSNIERAVSPASLDTLLRLLAALRLELVLKDREDSAASSPWQGAR
jgi:HTH-type transcriptional regulator/antitoxin HipB